MARDEVLYGYALLDDSKHTVSIDDIDRPFTRLHKFYCPHCHNEMYATFGEVQLPHFRHNGDKCQHSKYLHDLAEHVFYEEYSRCLEEGLPFYLEIRIPRPCNGACVLKKHADCKEHYLQKIVDLTQEYTLISLETRVDIDERYRRPDILLESLDGKQLWVEIWVSHETEEDKRKDGRIIEIKIETEKDLEKIVQSEEEDLAVRIFSIETDGADALFMDDDDLSVGCFPCEKYFWFEAGTGGFKSDVFDYIRTSISSDLSYRVVMRLNWQGRHDSIGGTKGKQTTLDDLRVVCLQRYYSHLDNRSLYRDKSYDSLIVSEWKSESIKPAPVPKTTPSYRSSYRPHYQAPMMPATTTADTSAIEWVDLGLPSGTLWAKEDIEGKMSFGSARRTYGANLPSYTKASELRECCSKEWDGKTHALVLTGPNGNSIAFPCKESNKSYWLNAYEKGDPEFGQCFHIGPDGHFWINDKEAISSIFVRLVK